ncbi:MAG: metalloregulator ArsR/SmtB family transcription factor [Rhodospirillum sp.]|nr:metalloregulator ArsR/SmtB family transcription factor [Rhodospirillum sp.]MCF8489510.1 metalloregulator ArsR/SmtB family transcription factor [Rhodospirillum sp.]MCF8500565.1 metalloregulator ArsR/SmtB family transcription factor [Rhodospirillum sp.]
MTTTTAARAFAALAHETRLTVFRTLARVGELSASDLASRVGLTPSALSFHLKDLRATGLVESRRDGRWVLYSACYATLTTLTAYLGSSPSSSQDLSEIHRTGKASLAMRSPETPYQVLFLCTGNSSRGIMAEGLLNRLGKGKVLAHSGGGHPRGKVDPVTLDLMKREGYALHGFRSKSWEEFALPESAAMDFVFTVCDAAAGEVCPIWPGQPMTAHWGVPDPVQSESGDTERALMTADVYRMLSHRIESFLSLPLASLDRLSLQRKLDQIGLTADQPGTRDAAQ